MQGVATVVTRDRGDPLGLVGGHVRGGHDATVSLGVALHRRRNFSAVKSLSMALPDESQGLGGCGQTKALGHMRRTPMRQECLRKPGLRSELRQAGRGGPLVLHDHGHRITPLGHFNGRGHQVRKGQLAIALVQRNPTRHSAGHRHAVPTALGRRFGVWSIFAVEVLRRPSLRRAARGIEALQLFPIPQDAKHVRPQAVAARLHQGHDSRRGNGSVDGASPLGQDLQARLRGQWVRSGHHVASKDGGALAGIARRPIEIRIHDVVSTKQGPWQKKSCATP